MSKRKPKVRRGSRCEPFQSRTLTLIETRQETQQWPPLSIQKTASLRERANANSDIINWDDPYVKELARVEGRVLIDGLVRVELALESKEIAIGATSSLR
ncbi:hypothetical protein [Mesorhizobium sp. 10J20-29]